MGCASCGEPAEGRLCSRCNEILSRFQGLRILARTFLTVQRTRMSLRSKSELAVEGSIKPILETAAKWARQEENAIKKAVMDLAENAPYRNLMEWGRRANLGPVMLLLFMGEVNPTEPTAGKIWAYWGLTPEGKRVSGRKAKGNIALKGKAYMMASIIIYNRTPYYYDLFMAKKDYYKGKNLRPVVADNKARFWLAKLLLSHAHEIIRRGLGLPAPHILHHNYIPPKLGDDALNMKIVKKVAPVLRQGLRLPPQEIYGDLWERIKRAVALEYGEA